MSHYQEKCQYGFIHNQCRCAGPKTVVPVHCAVPSHATAVVVDFATVELGGPVQLELPFDPPLEKNVLSSREQERRAEVLDRFAFHPATPVTGPKHDEARAKHRELADWLLENVPAGRHQACALTSLQESMMWSNAAIACDTKAS